MSVNLDLIRATYETGPSVLLPALAPDVEWTEAEGFPYGGTYRGVDAVAQNVFARLGSEWEGFRISLQNLYDAGETIIGTGFYEGTYKATGQPMRASFAHVFTLKDGKIIRFVQYVDSKKVWEAIEPK